MATYRVNINISLPLKKNKIKKNKQKHPHKNIRLTYRRPQIVSEIADLRHSVAIVFTKSIIIPKISGIAQNVMKYV